MWSRGLIINNNFCFCFMWSRGLIINNIFLFAVWQKCLISLHTWKTLTKSLNFQLKWSYSVLF
jgi:hypothetical protein